MTPKPQPIAPTQHWFRLQAALQATLPPCRLPVFRPQSPAMHIRTTSCSAIQLIFAWTLAAGCLAAPKPADAGELAVERDTRLGAGLSAGYTSYYREEPSGSTELVQQWPVSPMVTAAIALSVRPVSLYLGLQSQPLLNYYFGGSGHVGAAPILCIESGLELDFGPVSLGVSGAIGLTALSTGPHVRILAASGPTWDHNIELRAAWLPSRSGEVALLYSPSHRWRKNK